ncbi:hypothetical protein JCM10207_004390 [Rhodosporidiobolus poonsookiae]
MARIRSRTTQGTPVTALAHLPNSTHALAASSSSLILLNLGTAPKVHEQRQWRVFERERVHRIVLQPGEEGEERARYRALVTGGREAVLVDVVLPVGDSPAALEILVPFQLDDFVGDSAFLGPSHVLLATLHNSIKVYRLPPLPSSSSAASPAAPVLAPLATLHAPLRPVLWSCRFSSVSYSATPAPGPEREAEGHVRLAGGTMWGDVFLWDVGTAGQLVALAGEAGRGGEGSKREVTRQGGLRRLVGHKGSIFTVSFSPSSTHLLTASDDRTLRVFSLPPPSPSIPLEDDLTAPVLGVESEKAVAVWGSEGRVWRAEWAGVAEEGGEARVVSVGEDAACRLWRVALPSLPASLSSSRAAPSPPYTLLTTLRDAHDGRSIWAVGPFALPCASAAAGEQARVEGVLTGGADGGVRSWVFPASSRSVESEAAGEVGKQEKGVAKKLRKDEQMKSFTVSALKDGTELVASLTMDGSFRLSLAPPVPPAAPSSAYLPSPSPAPVHLSAAFVGASTAVQLALLPLPSHSSEQDEPRQRLRLVAMSNRGGYLSCVVSLPAAVAAAGDRGLEVKLETEQVVEHPLPLRAAEIAFHPLLSTSDGDVRAAVWDRASWCLSMLDLPCPSFSPAPPAVLAHLDLSPRGTSPYPTTLKLLSPTHVLVGLSSGGVALYALSSIPPSASASASSTPPHELHELARLDAVLSDGVTALSVLSRDGDVEAEAGPARWAVRTAGRDGRTSLLEIEIELDGELGEGEGRARVRKVDERVVAKGPVEAIISPSPASGEADERFLALLDTRAVVLDSLSQTLIAFSSPGKRIPAQLVSSSANGGGGMSYYRLLSGRLHRQTAPSSLSPLAPPPILKQGLHGREIRAIKGLKMDEGRVLLATAAENGVLSLSELTSGNAIHPIYINRHLPSSLKALAWTRPFATSRPSSSLSSSSSAQPSPSPASHLLFACGTRELLCAFLVTCTGTPPFPSPSALRVLPAGMVLADEGDEIRTMDMALIEVEVEIEGTQRRVGESMRVLVAGYSDGKIKLWRHSLPPAPTSSSANLESTFALLAETPLAGGEKCVLSVEAVEVEVAGRRRWVVASGSSDGLRVIFTFVFRAVRELIQRFVNSFVDSLTLGQPVETALPPPFYSFHPHQSGINGLAVSVEGSSLVIATAGDDDAVSARRLTLSLDEPTGTLAASAGPATMLADAHASTIQGLDFLSSTTLASSSVDQRLNLYSLSLPSPSSLSSDAAASTLATLQIVDSTCLDVADCSAQAVLEGDAEAGGEGARRVVVAGIGVEVVEVEL